MFNEREFYYDYYCKQYRKDKEALEEMQTQAGAGKNKTIMSVLEFRQALSFAVNRVEFCLACDPTGKPSKSVFNTLIISDPENGTAFRTNEEAKDVVLNFWGLADQVGEGKKYATKDEAIKLMRDMDEPYKVELINELPEDAEISFYKHFRSWHRNVYCFSFK